MTPANDVWAAYAGLLLSSNGWQRIGSSASSTACNPTWTNVGQCSLHTGRSLQFTCGHPVVHLLRNNFNSWLPDSSPLASPSHFLGQSGVDFHLFRPWFWHTPQSLLFSNNLHGFSPLRRWSWCTTTTLPRTIVVRCNNVPGNEFGVTTHLTTLTMIQTLLLE